jgi:multiple sugar transport system permease protein
LFGVEDPPGWVSDPNLALYTVATVICWQALGVCVVIYLAGLQGIPRDLLEAAEIDGAGPVTRFRTVTFPLLAPAVTINVILTLISGFKVYDQVKVITNGGPGVGTTNTLAFDIVRVSVESGQVGYGQAMATVMLAIIAFVSIAVMRLLQRREVSL